MTVLIDCVENHMPMINIYRRMCGKSIAYNCVIWVQLFIHAITILLV